MDLLPTKPNAKLLRSINRAVSNSCARRCAVAKLITRTLYLLPIFNEFEITLTHYFSPPYFFKITVLLMENLLGGGAKP